MIPLRYGFPQSGDGELSHDLYRPTILAFDQPGSCGKDPILAAYNEVVNAVQWPFNAIGT
jgi:hypothetical protein